MTVRGQLEETLKEHLALIGESGPVQAWYPACECGWAGPEAHIIGEAETAFTAHVADVLLTLPGIAIVALPEPNATRYEGDEHSPEDRDGWWQPGGQLAVTQWGYPGEVQLAYADEPFEPLNVDEARFIAAALLAAAAVAERRKQ